MAGLEGQLFDLTVANILAPALIFLAPNFGFCFNFFSIFFSSIIFAIFSRFTKKGGSIALSGLVHRQAETVMNAYRQDFNDLKVEAIEDDWVLITGVKR